MITDFETDNEGIEDKELFRKIVEERNNGNLSDTDRVRLPAADDTVRLFSAFGYGASDEMFEGICRANFGALNPEQGASRWT